MGSEDSSGKLKTSGKWRAVEPLDELRVHPRFRVDAQVDVSAAQDWPAQPIVNLSVGGMCVAVPEPSAIGERVGVVLRSAETDPVELEGEVRWASATHMGMEFTCGPTNSAVLEFLNATRIAVVRDERDQVSE